MDYETLEKLIKESVADSVKHTVNGKIDALKKDLQDHNERHEAHFTEVKAHMEEVRPIIDAYRGGRVLGEVVKWLAGVGAAFLIIQGWINKI